MIAGAQCAKNDLRDLDDALKRYGDAIERSWAYMRKDAFLLVRHPFSLLGSASHWRFVLLLSRPRHFVRTQCSNVPVRELARIVSNARVLHLAGSCR